jgi:hypothetical protein
MSLGLGQWKSGATATSPKESLGGFMTFVGGLSNMMLPADMQSTGWGKFNIALGVLGTALNLSGRRESAKMQRNFARGLQENIGNALMNLENL